MPAVPPPEACPERSVARLLSSNLNALLEFRLAGGEFPDRAEWEGRGGIDLLCWVRSRNGARLDRPLLAVIAHRAALALAGALRRPTGGCTLGRGVGRGRPDRVLLHDGCAGQQNKKQ